MKNSSVYSQYLCEVRTSKVYWLQNLRSSPSRELLTIVTGLICLLWLLMAAVTRFNILLWQWYKSRLWTDRWPDMPMIVQLTIPSSANQTCCLHTVVSLCLCHNNLDKDYKPCSEYHYSIVFLKKRQQITRIHVEHYCTKLEIQISQSWYSSA